MIRARAGNPPAVIDGKSWAGGPIRCTNASHCIVPGVSSNKLYVTNAGIASVASDFQTIVPDPKVGWFQGPFVAVGPRNGESSAQSVVISGLGLCNSTNGGYRFSCKSPVDPTFDGGIALQMAELQSGDAPIRYGAGLVCGGEISEPMSGWVHTTADGGGKPHDHRWNLGCVFFRRIYDRCHSDNPADRPTLGRCSTPLRRHRSPRATTMCSPCGATTAGTWATMTSGPR